MSLRNIITLSSIFVLAAVVTLIMTSSHLPMNNMDRIFLGSKSAKAGNESYKIIGILLKGRPLQGILYSNSGQSITLASGLGPETSNTSGSKTQGGFRLNDSPLLMHQVSEPVTKSGSMLPLNDSTGTRNDILQGKNVSYNVKYICGSVSGNEGPLRPGHYDTDISIFNNQGFTVPLLWNAVSNNGKSTTSVLKTLQPGTSSGIACSDLFQLFGIQNVTSSLVEGFVVISPQTSAGGIASFSGNSATIPSRPLSQSLLNPLTVQVFYSANALSSLPRNITMDKILFSISNDTSSKLPTYLLGKVLDVTIQSQVNQISDPQVEVRDLLSSKYKLSPQDVTHLKIQIVSVGLGATSMIDDHAISSFQVMPQAGP